MSEELSHLMKLVKPLYKYATGSWQLDVRYSNQDPNMQLPLYTCCCRNVCGDSGDECMPV